MKNFYYQIDKCVWDNVPNTYVLWIFKSKKDKENGNYLHLIPDEDSNYGCTKEYLKLFVKDFLE